jgi:hypothetical protein
LDYAIEWDGHTVTLPAVGDSAADGVSFTSFDDAELRLAKFAVSMFDSAPKGQTRISVPVVLIPRPDNEYDQDAVSVAAPRSMGGDKDARHLGFLYRRFIDRLGNHAIPRLAELSDGEIHCTAIIERDDSCYDDLDFDDPDDLKYAFVDINLAVPRGGELARAIEDFFSANGADHDDQGRQRTDHVLERLRTFETAETPVGPLSLATQAGEGGEPSSLTIRSGDTPIGRVALGYLFLHDERHRRAVLDGLRRLDIPVAQSRAREPQAVADPEWVTSDPPNVSVDWRAGGLKLRWAEPEGPSTQTTFAQYNLTTKKLWVEDRRLVTPACVFAARLGLAVAEIGLPPRRWTLRERVWRGHLRDLSYEWVPNQPKMWALHPRVADVVPANLFDATELERIAQPCWKSGEEPTELLEKLTTYRRALFVDHTYLGILGKCRVCERPAGQFRTPICTETLAYCHRCLAIAADGLPNMAGTLDRATARATVAVRALAEAEFGGAAFVEAQLAAIQGDPQHPVAAADIDRRLLLRIAITRGQLAWTRILVDAGLADDGIRLSRGAVLQAVDGHLCLSMQEKAVDDFLHQHGIDHAREPLYPYDKQLNPNTRRRADWLLSDGTFVEMWGMPNDPTYAAKMREKTELATRHRLQLIGLTSKDIGRLGEIFAPLGNKIAAADAQNGSPPKGS